MINFYFRKQNKVYLIFANVLVLLLLLVLILLHLGIHVVEGLGVHWSDRNSIDRIKPNSPTAGQRKEGKDVND